MKLEKTFFKDVLLFKLSKFFDKRGSFYENYNKKDLNKYFKNNFIIDAISINKKNVLRGLHYQTKYQQDKKINRNPACPAPVPPRKLCAPLHVDTRLYSIYFCLLHKAVDRT